jgi:hypothetical protein
LTLKGKERTQMKDTKRTHDKKITTTYTSSRDLVEDTTWKIFMRVYVDRQPPAAVAREFGVSRNKVYVAQCRCLARVRAIVDRYLDDSP